MLKVILTVLFSISVIAPAMANNAVRETTIVVDVMGAIHVRKPSLNVEFKKHNNMEMKADMDWEVYWTLNNNLQIDYTCTNEDPKNDMCSKIRIEIEDNAQTVELSTTNSTVFLDRRTRFKNDPLNTTAYLDTNGLAGGKVKATGRLVLSQKI